MSLPYNPSSDEAFTIAPLWNDPTLPSPIGPGDNGKCDFCGRRVWLNTKTIQFMEKHEVPAICTECAGRAAKRGYI